VVFLLRYSLQYIHNSRTIAEEDLPPIAKAESLTKLPDDEEDGESEEVDLNPKPSPCHRAVECIQNGWYRFVKVFDLGLLNDLVYLNMVSLIN
jgi:hypothetical protein